jgi:hypothetical protein
MARAFNSMSLLFILAILSWGRLCVAQASQQFAPPDQQNIHEHSPGQPAAPQLLSGSISGTIVDPSGALVAGARVTLAPEDQSARQEALTDGNGQFSFTNVAPGPFHLAVASAGFAPQTVSGVLHPGETETVPQVALAVASNLTEVNVALTRNDIATEAEAEIKVEEKQRVLGIVPNFYVSYIPHAAPLTSKQKFKLATRSLVDPFTLLVVGASAGVEQAQNHFFEYGQGAQGYAKRFGANYGDAVSGIFIGGAVLPSLLKQDPRYFYKGTGSARSRFLYALAMSVVCKGDNGRWQPNYSGILGSLAAGGISNLYYPSEDRNSAALTFDNTAIGIASTAITNVLQEFVMRRLTPHTPPRDPANP